MTPGDYITAEAASDLHGKEFYIAKLDTNNKVALATAGTDEIVGVIQQSHQGTNPGAVSIAHVSGSGTGKVIGSTVIARNAYLTATTGGKAVGTTTPGHRVFGRARRACAQADDVFEYEKMYFIYPVTA